MLKMDLEYESGILFLRFNGKLVRRTNYKINNYIVPVINKHKLKYIIYNLKDLKEIDESGIDAILNTKCAIRKNKGKIILCEVSDDLVNKIKRLKIQIESCEKTALKKLEVNM